MRHGWLGLTLLTLFAATTSQAFNEPDGFRGIPWQSSEADLKAKWPGLYCLTPKEVRTWDRLCSLRQPLPIGDIPVKPILGLRGGTFQYVLLVFASAKFTLMERIFVERYGPPTTQDQKPVQNRMGAQYVNEYRYWTGQTIVITLQKYGGKLTESYAIFAPPSMTDDLLKETEDAAKKGAGDL